MILRMLLALVLTIPACVVEARCYTNSQGQTVCDFPAARSVASFAAAPVQRVFNTEPQRVFTSSQPVEFQPVRSVFSGPILSSRDRGSGLLSRILPNRSARVSARQSTRARYSTRQTAGYSQPSYSQTRYASTSNACPYCGRSSYEGYSQPAYGSAASSGTSYGGYAQATAKSKPLTKQDIVEAIAILDEFATELEVRAAKSKSQSLPIYRLPATEKVEATSQESSEATTPTAKAPMSAKVPAQLIARVPTQMTGMVPQVLVATVPNNAPSPSSFLLTAN